VTELFKVFPGDLCNWQVLGRDSTGKGMAADAGVLKFARIVFPELFWLFVGGIE
jgi:hypothetical protein